MIEPTRRVVDHCYYTKRVLAKQGEEDRVGFCMTLTQCPITDEQLAKLLNILDKAAEEAAAVMKWPPEN